MFEVGLVRVEGRFKHSGHSAETLKGHDLVTQLNKPWGQRTLSNHANKYGLQKIKLILR